MHGSAGFGGRAAGLEIRCGCAAGLVFAAIAAWGCAEIRKSLRSPALRRAGAAVAQW